MYGVKRTAFGVLCLHYYCAFGFFLEGCWVGSVCVCVCVEGEHIYAQRKLVAGPHAVGLSGLFQA